MNIHFFSLALVCSAIVSAYSIVLFKAAHATTSQTLWLSGFTFLFTLIEMIVLRYASSS